MSTPLRITCLLALIAAITWVDHRWVDRLSASSASQAVTQVNGGEPALRSLDALHHEVAVTDALATGAIVVAGIACLNIGRRPIGRTIVIDRRAGDAPAPHPAAP